MTEPLGWPFLIGAGRRHEYRTLLAPEFLLAGYGVLDRHARAGAPGDIRVVAFTGAGRPLWMAYETRPMPTVRDEHSRPLQVLTGFVCDSPIAHVHPADLATANHTGMAVYRTYLTDEDTFTVRPSTPFPLRSTLRAPAPEPTPAPRRGVALLSLTAAVLLAALITVLLLTLHGGNDNPGCATPTPTDQVTAATCGTAESPD